MIDSKENDKFQHVMRCKNLNVSFWCLSISLIIHDITFQVEKFLSGRLEAGLKSWTDCLKGSRTTRHIDDTDSSMMAHKPGGDPDIQVHRNTKKLFWVSSSYMMDAWCFLRTKPIIKRKDLIYSLSDSLKKSKQNILHHICW